MGETEEKDWLPPESRLTSDADLAQAANSGKFADLSELHSSHVQPHLHCPRCGGLRIVKAGFDAKGGQLFLCKTCLRRFHVERDVSVQLVEQLDPAQNLSDADVFSPDLSVKPFLEETAFKCRKNVASHVSSQVSVIEKPFNSFRVCNRDCRICATETKEARNLATVRAESERTVQDRENEETLRGEIVAFKFSLLKRSLSEKTAYNRGGSVELLYRNGANLQDPDSVLTLLATTSGWKTGTKKQLFQAYKCYAKWKKIDLSNVELPRFKRESQMHWVPKETLLDQLIAGAGWKTGAFCQLLKETGARTVEAARLKWIDVDGEGKIITISDPAKGGMPRQLAVSEKCVEMLLRQPKNGDYVFGRDPETIRRQMRHNFHWARGHVAAKTANKDVLRIHLHTFRHFFATKLYLQAQDLRYVQKKMGHRSITSTTIYENSEPCQNVETYTSKVAVSDDEKLKLVNLGYEYTGMNTKEGLPIMRKKVVWI
jgi:integrase